MPHADRPHMPDYGLPATDEGLLDWAWAEERLRDAHNYWLATSRPDGRPHAAPVWGIWVDDGLFFSTAGRKARNLAADPEAIATTERADEAVIVEGAAAPLTDRSTLERYVALYNDKYSWDMDPSAEGYYLLVPRVAFGFIEHAGQFAATATRWRFDVARS